ncbi:hypothetical protein L3Y34_010990 [Caenorhabditis briggsae]|uniref:Uncharacterized protein n=1 Tax=Caenorhabditis briggsae TaxID=6238 RepID=A0AAE8ZRQ5_CAEBR|nr:hypothetical protein L3Y34_010990 [Caenorhabditis briggsae]
MFSFLVLGQDLMVTTLTTSAIAMVLSLIGIILVCKAMLGRFKNRQPPVVLNTIRINTQRIHIPDRPPLPPYLPSYMPPFPVPPPQILMGETSISIPPPPESNPPSYHESAEIEERRITDNSNAPPAYNRTNYVSDNNIASFSPPPYYSPPSPFFGSAEQTTSMYLSSEDLSTSPVPISPLPLRNVQLRAPSPVRRHPARKPRRSPRQPKPQATVIRLQDEDSGASTSTAVPKTSTRTPLPQMFIDCSKAEPTLFTINGGLWE